MYGGLRLRWTFLSCFWLSAACASSGSPSVERDRDDDPELDAEIEPGGELGLDAGRDADRPRMDAQPADDGPDARPSDASARDATTDALVRDSGLPPFHADGEPIDAPEGTWTWVEFPDAYCRDGSKAGISINRRAGAKDLMIYLEGGGACFDGISCLANPATASRTPPPNEGVFKRDEPKNPLRDFNYVHVPYCTGDVHAGTNPAGAVPGLLGAQKFVGRLNIEAFLKRVVPTFKDSKRVVLTGISAGGFGASANAVLVQRAFPDVKVTLIDDSGPPMSGKYLAPCLQKIWRDMWGLDKSMLADCGSDCANQEDFVLDFALHLAKNYADRKAGLIEATNDGVISGFFGAGTNGCTGVVLLTPIPGPEFEKGLLEFRDRMKGYPNFFTYYPTGTQHTWLRGASFYTATVDGTPMVDWVTNIIEDRAVEHVGP